MWLLPLLQFEQSIYKDVATSIVHSNAILFCPACRKMPVLKNALLCAYCGALLHRSAPAIDAASFYSFQPLQNGLIWEHLLPDEKWPFFGSVRNSHGFCEIGKLMELPCFAPHYITSVPSPLQTHSQVDEASDATPVAKPIFWENWNTRTQSTVQYVGYDNQKGVKAEEEEEEDADVAVEKSTPRLKTTPPAQEDEEVEDEEEHRAAAAGGGDAEGQRAVVRVVHAAEPAGERVLGLLLPAEGRREPVLRVPHAQEHDAARADVMVVR